MQRSLLFLIVVLVSGVWFSGCNSSDDDDDLLYYSPDTLVMSPANGTTLTATEGALTLQAVTVNSGGTAPYTFIPNGLPSGLEMIQTSTFAADIVGFPSTVGSSTVLYQIIDANNGITDLSYPVTVDAAAATTLSLVPATARAGTAGSAYTETLTVGAGTAPYVWSISYGALPPGLTLSGSTIATETISGTPTTPGAYAFAVSITDSSGTARTGGVVYMVTIN